MPADYEADPETEDASIENGEAPRKSAAKTTKKHSTKQANEEAQPTAEEMSVLASVLASKNGHLEPVASTDENRISDDDLDFSVDGAVSNPLLHPMQDRRPTGTHLAVAIKKALKATSKGTGRSEADIINDALRRHLPNSMIVKFFNKAANETGFIGERDWIA